MIVKIFSGVKKLLFCILFLTISILVVYIWAYFYLQQEDKYLKNGYVLKAKEQTPSIVDLNGKPVKVKIYLTQVKLEDKSIVEVTSIFKHKYKQNVCVKYIPNTDSENGSYVYYDSGICRIKNI